MSGEGFAIRLRAATLPPAGVEAAAQFRGETLVVETAGRERPAAPLIVAAEAIRVSVGGFDDNQLFLDWTDANQLVYSAEPLDRAARDALVASAPPGLAPRLGKARGRASRQDFKVRALVGTAAALVLATLLVVFNLSAVERWLASQVPLKTEQRLGRATVEELEDEGKLIETGLMPETVAAIGKRLTVGSRYQYRWFVREDDEVNAFAIPGGNIVVHTGLLEELQSPEELAGVLAHEIQHVESRHTLQQMIHMAGLATVMAVTLGDVSTIAAILMHSAGSARHSRKLEAEADGGGLQRLTEAGIPREGLASFFRRQMQQRPDCKVEKDQKPKDDCLPAAEAGARAEPGAGKPKPKPRRRRRDDEEDSVLSWLSSHPGNRARLAAIEARIAALPCPACQPLTLDWAAVRQAAKAASGKSAAP